MRKDQCVIYKVPRATLKQYQTQKTEAAIGIERRPEKRYIVEDKMFEDDQDMVAEITKEVVALTPEQVKAQQEEAEAKGEDATIIEQPVADEAEQ